MRTPDKVGMMGGSAPSHRMRGSALGLVKGMECQTRRFGVIFHSPYPDILIPDTPVTPFVLRHARRLAEKPALIDGVTGRTLSYGQLADAIQGTAAGLAEHGFRKGEVFAIYAPNCLEYPVAFHAVASCGGITTTINPLFTTDELTHQLTDAGASYLLTTSDLLQRASEAAARAGVREVFVVDEAPDATPFASLSTSAGTLPVVVPIDPDADLAALPFSSGTTGLPKGVMLTHANLVANVAQIAACEPVSEADTLIGVLPFFHIYGLTVLMNFGLAAGATIVVLPRFELGTFLRTLETYRVTYAYVAPPVVLALAKQPEVEQFDLSRLRVILSGGAPLSSNVTDACHARIGCYVKQGYGLTETSPVTHFGAADPEQTPAGSIGVLLPNTEAKVISPASGLALGHNEDGELWIRGPQVMNGYLNRPEETAAMLDGDRWLHTGDLGYADADGNFTIVDRLKELIKYKGFQVAPAELEAILLSHPAVADAAVIPSPDEDAGEVPKAFLVLRHAATPNELMAFVAERVAPYKKVRRLELIDRIPKSATGKILRRVLVERERAACADPVLV
jgi:acyl-CoA synthetase (AMP-forming)/AMP-acid ligase II